MTTRLALGLVVVIAACASGNATQRADAGSVDLDSSHPPDTRWLFFDAGPARDFGPRPRPPPEHPLPPSGCLTGTPCTPDRGCRSGSCQAEIIYEIGGAGDEIVGHPAGRTAIAAAYFSGGYCTPSPVAMPATGCDPNDEAACGDPACGRCVDLGGVVMCMRSCTPNTTDNSECPQDTQTCLFDGYCFDGCREDDECRVFREDTDGDGYVEVPGPLEPAVDRLRYDELSRAVCNPDTRRCEQPSGGGAAGSPCTRSSQCEEDGICLTTWVGGYCTRLGCNVPGFACEGAGKCQSRRVDGAMCAQACTVGAESADPTLLIGTSAHGVGCRTGYACVWDGIGAGEGNGICAPGRYNDRTENNVGAGCDVDDDCYSPYGQGMCLGGDGTVWGPDGYCSILDCAAPGMPFDLCGPAAQCLVFFSTDGESQDLGACFETCTTADTCNTGDACIPATAIAAGTPGNVCFPICTADTDCRTGQRCNIAPGFVTGECV